MTARQISPTTSATVKTAPISIAAHTWLIGILLLTIVARVASALFQGNEITALPGIYDQISYDGLARRVIAGHGFSFGESHWPATRAGEPTAHWSYLYTLYLAAVYAVTDASPLVARLIQAVLTGVAHCWLVWRIGRRVFGATTGLIASGLSAVYIYFVYYAGALITEPFYFVGLLWTLDVTMRLADTATPSAAQADARPLPWRLWVEFGLAVGITVLLRQLFLLLVPFLLLWIGWRFLQVELENRQFSLRALAGFVPAQKTLFLGACIAILVIAALIVPWTIRNYRAFDVFVPLNTNSGFAFFWGNHPVYGTRFVGILSGDGPSYQDLIPQELLELNEAELDRALLNLGIGFVLDDPVRYALLSISRMREYFKFWPASDSSVISNWARVLSFGVLLPWMMSGVGIALRNFRDASRRRQGEIVLLLLFILIYTAIHLLTWALIRYRLPVDCVLLIFAAYAIETLWRRMRATPQRLPTRT